MQVINLHGSCVMKNLFVLPLLLACSGSMAFGDVTVKPAGMQVVWHDGAEHFDGFKTFNSKPGIKLALLLETDGNPFVGLDQNKSKVTVNGVKADCWFFGSNGLSKDLKHLKLDVSAEGAKVKDGKVEAKGELVVSTASGKGEVSTEMIEWKKGATVEFPKEAGLPTFKVEKIGKPDWGDEKWQVTLKCNKDFEKFVSAKFVDEDGNEHKATRGGWSSMGFFGKKTVTVSYKAPVTLSKAKMVIEVWKDVQKVKVPINLSVGGDGAP